MTVRSGSTAAKRRGCNGLTVIHMMRDLGLYGKTRRKFVKTTDSKHALPVAPNLLDMNFTPEAPNTVWASDITYIPTKEGWLYLAVTMDLFARTIGGWSMDHTMTAELPLGELNMAVSRRNPPAGLIHHSDRGSRQASSWASVLPKKPVRQPPVSNCFKGQQDAVQHESEGGLLGQCRGRELFRDFEA